MKKKNVVSMVSGIIVSSAIVTAMSGAVFAEAAEDAAQTSDQMAEAGFTAVEYADAAGYYYSDETGLLILPNGVYAIDGATAEKKADHIIIYSNGTDFIIDDPSGDDLYLKKQTEKEKTESGEIYYALYSDFIGTTDTAEFTEGQNLQIGTDLFGMNYEVVLRQSAAKFFDFEEDNSDLSRSGDFVEGAGFDTPEEALAAYIEAFKNKDLDAMYATFAVESYCENYNIINYVQRIGAISSAILQTLPLNGEDEFTTQRNIEIRKNEILKQISYQMNVIAYANAPGEELETLLNGAGVLQLRSEGEKAFSHEDLENLLSDLQNTSGISDIEIVGFLSPIEVTDSYLSPANMRNMYMTAKICGADGYKSLGAIIRIGNKNAVMFMDVIRYDSRWYNYSSNGILSTLSALSNTVGGLLIETDGFDLDEMLEEFEERKNLLAEELQEVKSNYLEVHEEALEEAKDSYGVSSDTVRNWYDQYLEENGTYPDVDIYAIFDFDEMADFYALEELQ